MGYLFVSIKIKIIPLFILCIWYILPLSFFNGTYSF